MDQLCDAAHRRRGGGEPLRFAVGGGDVVGCASAVSFDLTIAYEISRTEAFPMAWRGNHAWLGTVNLNLASCG